MYFNVGPGYNLSKKEHDSLIAKEEAWLFREKTDDELKVAEICEKFHDSWKERHKLGSPLEAAVLLLETDDRIKNHMLPKIKYLFENEAPDNLGKTPTFQITRMVKNNGYIRVTADYGIFDPCYFGQVWYKDWCLFRFVIHFKDQAATTTEFDESNIYIIHKQSFTDAIERIIEKNKSNPSFDYMDLL